MTQATTLLDMPRGPRHLIYRRSLTRDLFSLMATHPRFRAEGLVEVKKRFKRLSVPVGNNWSVAECKEAYLWHFGNPTMICAGLIPMNCSVALTSRGVALLWNKEGQYELAEMTFRAWTENREFGRCLPIERLSAVDVSNRLTICRHKENDFALLNGGQPSLVELNTHQVFTFGHVDRATIDSTEETTQIATLKLEEENWHIRWCQLASLLRGQAVWTECRIPRTATEQVLGSIERAYLEFCGSQLLLLRAPSSSDRWSGVAAVDLATAKWQAGRTLDYWPDANSPLPADYFTDHSQPRTMVIGGHPCNGIGGFPGYKQPRAIVIGGHPCYSLGLHPLDNQTIALLASSHKRASEELPIRPLHTYGHQLPQAPIAVLTTRIGCCPVVAGVWEGSDTKGNELIAWRLSAPESPFAALELSTKISLSAGKEEGWDEFLIERALRANAGREKWEPLLNSLWEDTQNTQVPEDSLTLLLHRLVGLAVTEARHDFLAYLFREWLPQVSANFEQPVLDEHFVLQQLTWGFQIGRTRCPIELINANGRQRLRLLPENEAGATRTEQLDNWLPLKATHNAIVSGCWEIVLPLLAASDIPDSLSPEVYRRLLNRIQGFHVDRDGETGQAIRKFFEDVLNVEPRIANCSGIIALAALLGNEAYLTETIKAPQIDLPNWTGDIDSWIERCGHDESSIFFALKSFEGYPDRFDRFVKWLASCELAGPVREALIHFVNWTTESWNQDNTELLKELQPKRRKLDGNL